MSLLVAIILIILIVGWRGVDLETGLLIVLILVAAGLLHL